MRPAAALADRLGLTLGDPDLVEQALVHTSWVHEHPDATVGHNERLEFLGDAVVNLAISEALFTAHPSDDEGMLSARRASIVSTVGLARLAHRIELGGALFLGEGESQRGGRRRPSILASAFEALAGALYLDLGYDRTRDWLTALAAPEIAMDAPASSLKSPKSRLQEHTQRETGSRPEYHVVEATGPDHEKLFRIEVVVDGRPLGVGEGPSRRIAETAAAQRALEQIRAEAGHRESPAEPTAPSDISRSAGPASPLAAAPVMSPEPAPTSRAGSIAGPAEPATAPQPLAGLDARPVRRRRSPAAPAKDAR